MIWPSLRDLVAFRPALDAVSASRVAEDAYSGGPADGSTHRPEPRREAADDRQRRIRFDNTIRMWVAVPTYVTCLALHAGGAIDSVLPITGVVLSYLGALFGIFTLFFNVGFTRLADFLLAALDVVAMSFAVYFTGATASPLYFIYFVPVVIHAFHRDWNMILFSGFGGVVLYGAAVLVSMNSLSSAAMADLLARLIFMLLTVAVACLALSVLRKEEERDRLRIARLRAVSLMGVVLNRSCSTAEVHALAGDLGPVIGSALTSPEIQVTVHFQKSRFDASPLALGLSGGSDLPVPSVPLDFRGTITEVAVALEGEAAFGGLTVQSSRGTSLSEDDLRFLRFVAHSIALALRRQQVIEELRRSIEMGTAAAAVYLASGRSMGSAQVALVEGAVSLLSGDRAMLYLWNAPQSRLDATAWCGMAHPRWKVVDSKTGLTWINEAQTTGSVRTGVIPAGEGSASATPLSVGLAAPIRLSDGAVLGVLTVEREGTAAFSEDEIALAAAFACRSAHALGSPVRPMSEGLPPTSPRLAA